jgi:hypothetical protein
MNATIGTYIIYLALSIAVTFWVGHTLHKHGRIFLVDAFHANEPLADSINHLLLVGFYLINLGYVVLALKTADKPMTAEAVFETLSTKIGVVLLVLGAMHFFNLYIFNRMRKRALLHGAPPPLPPEARIPVAAE